MVVVVVVVVVVGVIGWAQAVKWCWWAGVRNVESDGSSTNAFLCVAFDVGRASVRSIRIGAMRQAEHDHTYSGLYTMRQEACAMVSRMATLSQSLANECQAVRLLMLMQEVPRPDGPNGQMANKPFE